RHLRRDWSCHIHEQLSLFCGVVIQQLRWSKNGRRPGRRCHLRLACEVVVEDGLTVWAKRFLELLAMTPYQIDAKLRRTGQEIAPSARVPFGELRDQLLDAGFCHGEGPLFIALLERDLF